MCTERKNEKKARRVEWKKKEKANKMCLRSILLIISLSMDMNNYDGEEKNCQE